MVSTTLFTKVSCCFDALSLSLRNKGVLLTTGVVLLAVAAQPAAAQIADDLAAAVVIEGFRFNDPAGTAYFDAVNEANPGNQLTADTIPTDLEDVETNGSGQLNASLKFNSNFGSTLADTTNITQGRVFGVMELAWDFQSTLDPAENEELRISLIRSGTSGVLAEFEIQREDDDTLTILGNTTGGTDLPAVLLNGGSLTQTDKFLAVLDADLSAGTYRVHYSADAGSNFTTLGEGVLGSPVVVDKIRLVLNNDLGNDNVLINQIYLAIEPIFVDDFESGDVSAW